MRYYETMLSEILGIQIDHILCISIEECHDRREKVAEEFNKIGSEVEFVIVKRHSNGAQGCLESHIKCIEIAKERQYPYVLICEDDVMFDQEQLKRSPIKMPDNWNMFFLGYNALRGHRYSRDLLKLTSSLAAHCYLIHSKIYDVVLDSIKTNWNQIPEMYDVQQLEWSFLGSECIDVFYAKYICHRMGDCYGIYPMIALQRPGQSTIQGRYMDYNKDLLDRSRYIAKTFNNDRLVSALIYGGLGNQLFQIATALCYAWDNNCLPIFSDKPWVRLGEELKYNETILQHLNWVDSNTFESLTFTKYKQPHFYYEMISYFEKSVLFDGYFQSYKYFDKYKSKLLSELIKVPEDLAVKVDEVWEDLRGPNTVAIHIRRGDTLANCEYHTLIPLTYYERCLQWFEDKLGGNAKYIIFSDDIEWCRQQELFKNVTFCSTDSTEMDFLLMSKCEHFIIGNSTFSWWAAYLANSDNVLYPSNWFGPRNAHLDVKDMYPENWIRMNI